MLVDSLGAKQTQNVGSVCRSVCLAEAGLCHLTGHSLIGLWGWPTLTLHSGCTLSYQCGQIKLAITTLRERSPTWQHVHGQLR